MKFSIYDYNCLYGWWVLDYWYRWGCWYN